jgi:Anti-sigma-K factor rskA
MNVSEPISRYDELAAGAAMGDLDHDEILEIKELGKDRAVDSALELMVASLLVHGVSDRIEPLPAALVTRLHQCAAAAVVTSPSNIVVPQWRKIASHPLIGWAAAAAIAVIAVVNTKPAPETAMPLTAQSLRANSTDLVERKFSSFGSYRDVSGNVIWSDAKQRGFMTLEGIPVNDPKVAQYQLWIVDPKRDEAPVDGGVFDIIGEGSPVVIPIMAKLGLSDPQMFVITLEQPGGVVKSKQEIIVALAKN